MSIYNRDQIPYSTMIQNAIANRNAAAQRDASYISNFGKIIGGAVDKVGNQIGRGIAVYEGEDEAKLRELEQEREMLIKQEHENSVKAMEGYRPAFQPIKSYESTLEDYNVNSNIVPEDNSPNPYLSAINQYYRRGR